MGLNCLGPGDDASLYSVARLRLGSSDVHTHNYNSVNNTTHFFTFVCWILCIVYPASNMKYAEYERYIASCMSFIHP